jgi:hypothetical protein
MGPHSLGDLCLLAKEDRFFVNIQVVNQLRQAA